MNVQQVMTRDVKVGRPDQPIEEIAKVMAGEDLGSLPIAEDGRLLGVITDRDIVVRGVALGLGPATQALELMSMKVLYCFEDQPVEEVASRMADSQVRRLPVVDRNNRLVGIVALADLARSDEGAAGTALQGVSQPVGAEPRSAGPSL